MFPYRPEEIFEIHPHAQVVLTELGNSGNKVVVVDNFYVHPEKVRELILSTPYPIWKHNENSRNFTDYYDCRHFMTVPYPQAQHLVQMIARDVLHIDILNADVNLVTNLFKLVNDQPKGGQPHPHDDAVQVAAILTLNTDDECSGGTAFYKHRDPEYLHMPPNQTDYEKEYGAAYPDDQDWEDGTNYFNVNYQKYWDVIDVVPMKFNRLLIYPGVFFHGAWHEHNAFKDFYRVNQVMFFDEVRYDPAHWPWPRR